MYSMKVLFDKLWENKKPFVFFRTPGANQITLYYQEDNSLHLDNGFSKEGFVMRPFKITKEVVCIPARQQKKFSIPKPKVFERKRPYFLEDQSQKATHAQWVSQALQEIQKGQLKKVVVSQKITVGQAIEDHLSFFLRLIHSHPNALVYFWHHPHTGTWVGATPERLLSANKKKYQTMALAGTLPYTLGEANWGEKERVEQQLVVDAILQGLKKIIPRDAIRCSPRYSKRAGHLYHLCTDIHFSASSRTVAELVRVLHPTPAVGGYPKEVSLQFIAQTEDYDRSYYSGILGPLGKDKKELFVNLRCAEIKKDKIDLYVGGGITEASQIELEWQELIGKSKALLRWL